MDFVGNYWPYRSDCALEADAQFYAVTKTAEAEMTKLKQLGEGEASKIKSVGVAEGAKITAIGGAEAKNVELLGLAKAKGFQEQITALSGNGGSILASIINAENIFKYKPTFVLNIMLGGGREGSSDSLIQLILAKTLGLNVDVKDANNTLNQAEVAPKSEDKAIKELADTAIETTEKLKRPKQS